MRLWFVAFAVAAEIPLMVAHRLFPNHTEFLPLGGDEFTQLSVLVLMAIFFEELCSLASESLTYLSRMIRKNKKDRHDDH
jgi:hypothetical protein